MTFLSLTPALVSRCGDQAPVLLCWLGDFGTAGRRVDGKKVPSLLLLHSPLYHLVFVAEKCSASATQKG
jgi:hypothetical protein